MEEDKIESTVEESEITPVEVEEVGETPETEIEEMGESVIPEVAE